MVDPYGLKRIALEARDHLERITAAREEGLRHCRAAIQHASRAIRATHRGDHEDANAWLERAYASVTGAGETLRDHPCLFHAGFVHDAQKEYAEAMIFTAMVSGHPLPRPTELSVEIPAYLNGLAEAGSEGRRYVLDQLRSGHFDEADRMMSVMDDIYDELNQFDFPDAVTGGLRRTNDAFRAVLERTRGDLTWTAQHQTLLQAMSDFGRFVDR